MKNSIKKVKDVYDHVFYYYYHYVYDGQYDNEDNVMNNENLSRFLRCENEVKRFSILYIRKFFSQPKKERWTFPSKKWRKTPRRLKIDSLFLV